jgi:thiamine pyrophosphate-dependent acetolactate synthase large subunit-like protein
VNALPVPEHHLPPKLACTGHWLVGFHEIGTGFYAGPKREPYSPDFAAMARSYGAEGIAVKHSDQLGDALRHGVF